MQAPQQTAATERKKVRSYKDLLVWQKGIVLVKWFIN
jgi:hypothetical protein